MANDTTTATTYLVLQPDIERWATGPYVRSVRVVHARATKPSLKRGEIAVKLNLTFNDSALIDSIPEVSVDVSGFAVAPPEPVVAVGIG